MHIVNENVKGTSKKNKVITPQQSDGTIDLLVDRYSIAPDAVERHDVALHSLPHQRGDHIPTKYRAGTHLGSTTDWAAILTEVVWCTQSNLRQKITKRRIKQHQLLNL